ncbi:MAG: efflux RND transporter periplasmic adaptor subunit [Chloroflexi bacterium]|nr:efflux RND transporter periplasmic adaptor subunit [Chloroflexota bacterium]
MARLLLVLTILAFMGGGIWYYQTSLARPTEETVAVRRGSITASISATGKVVALQESRLSFKSPGRVRTLHVQEGQPVEEGENLAELETAALELAVKEAEKTIEVSKLKRDQVKKGARPEEIDAARARVEAAQARLDGLKNKPSSEEVAEARAALEKASVAVQDAQAAYDKVSWKTDIAELPQSRQLQLATLEYEAVKARYNQVVRGPTAEDIRAAESEVAAAKAELELKQKGPLPEELAILEKQIELAQILLEQAGIRLEDARLIAPMTGTILSIPIHQGEYVIPQQVVMSMGDISRLRIKANIDDVDIGKVVKGQEVSITMEAFPGQKFTGTVTEIAPDATVLQGATVYPTTIEFPSPNLALRPGMSADLDIAAQKREGSLLIPNRAVQTIGRKKVVEVIEGDKKTKKTVEVGLSNDTETEIVEGLKEGDVVVVK